MLIVGWTRAISGYWFLISNTFFIIFDIDLKTEITQRDLMRVGPDVFFAKIKFQPKLTLVGKFAPLVVVDDRKHNTEARRRYDQCGSGYTGQPGSHWQGASWEGVGSRRSHPSSPVSAAAGQILVL